MIFIIKGAKGTDKTKNIIDRANASVLDGGVVFITDSNEYNYSITHKVRLINAKDYHVSTEQGLIGFISGLVAANHDTQHIYIDGAHRICGESLGEMAVFYTILGKISDNMNIDITLTVTCDDNNTPEFIMQYVK